MKDLIFTNSYAPGIQLELKRLLSGGYDSRTLRNAEKLLDKIPLARTRSEEPERLVMVCEAQTYLIGKCLEHISFGEEVEREENSAPLLDEALAAYEKDIDSEN